MTSRYFDEFLIVYLQNKTYSQGQMFYNFKCYHANYTGGVANITVPDTDYYDLYFTNGAVTWNITSGCPKTVENYEVWATVQSGIHVDSDLDLNYFINITRTGETRNYFWNTQSFKGIISIMVLLLILIISLIVGYFTKSGIAIILTFVVGLLIKIILGI
jgi:hypothetical protein